uniref:Distal membrane-arm assembly complex protein 1-like domain-containing protein n=1 Tax=Ornithorhynchus anatinus TaxID=9258 RepID=A0A6I8PG14_ORNAN
MASPPLAPSPSPAAPARTPLMGNCWSCRLICGTGLLGVGGYVYLMARRPMKLGIPPGPGHIAQMVFGIELVTQAPCPFHLEDFGEQPLFQPAQGSSRAQPSRDGRAPCLIIRRQDCDKRMECVPLLSSPATNPAIETQKLRPEHQ